MVMKKNRYRTIVLLITVLTVVACKTRKDLLVEPLKNFAGTWKVSRVVRNEVDLTPWVDSVGLRLSLNNDKTFLLQDSTLPIVSYNGTWSLDDPAYPFHILLKGKDSTNAQSFDLTAPVVMGKRTMVLTLSPGCKANKYVYTLENIQ